MKTSFRALGESEKVDEPLQIMTHKRIIMRRNYTKHTTGQNNSFHYSCNCRITGNSSINIQK